MSNVNGQTHEGGTETVFRNDDRGFIAWVARHPQGFILNRYRSNGASSQVLHRAHCTLFRTSHDSPYAFTGARFIKICADNVEPLEAHAKRIGGVLTRCRICNP